MQNKSAVFYTADFLFLPSISAIFHHFERSENSINRSFASLRMTTALWLFHRHFERSEKSIDRSFASLRMTAAVFGGFPSF
ncbi:MAG: hypothetical protein IJ566_05920 [Cardiobacteriaceae bacterium]|nr:hypothetical protein [Cardiobacteriaceae bacterium]